MIALFGKANEEKIMRKILIFIGLKIAEILGVCGIVGILYGIGLFAIYLNIPLTHKNWVEIALIGFVCVFGLPAIILLPYGIGHIIYDVIKANWAWADRITKKKR